MQRLYPSFSVKSYDEAVAFYVDWLGFTIDWEWRVPPASVYLQISRDNLYLHLSEQSDGASNGNCVAHVDDIAGLFAEWKAKRPDWDAKIQEMPWHVLRLDLHDPFGNHIAVQQNLP